MAFSAAASVHITMCICAFVGAPLPVLLVAVHMKLHPSSERPSLTFLGRARDGLIQPLELRPCVRRLDCPLYYFARVVWLNP